MDPTSFARAANFEIFSNMMAVGVRQSPQFSRLSEAEKDAYITIIVDKAQRTLALPEFADFDILQIMHSLSNPVANDPQAERIKHFFSKIMTIPNSEFQERNIALMKKATETGLKNLSSYDTNVKKYIPEEISSLTKEKIL